MSSLHRGTAAPERWLEHSSHQGSRAARTSGPPERLDVENELVDPDQAPSGPARHRRAEHVCVARFLGFSYLAKAQRPKASERRAGESA